MAAQRDLGIPREKLNINGGACALGPMAPPAPRSSRAACAEAQNLKRGVAALCIGGGEATALRWNASSTDAACVKTISRQVKAGRGAKNVHSSCLFCRLR
jgi:hypothetical protein